MNYISSLDIEFIHRPGEDIPTSDALSRDPRWLENLNDGERKFKMAEDVVVPETNLSQGAINARVLSVTPVDAGTAQKGEEVCKLTKEYLETGELPSGHVGKKVLTLAKSVALVDGLLMRPTKYGKAGYSQIYIPHGEFRKYLLKLHHDDPVAGHTGKKRMLDRLATRFWWPEMEKKWGIMLITATPCCQQEAGNT